MGGEGADGEWLLMSDWPSISTYLCLLARNRSHCSRRAFRAGSAHPSRTLLCSSGPRDSDPRHGGSPPPPPIPSEHCCAGKGWVGGGGGGAHVPATGAHPTMRRRRPVHPASAPQHPPARRPRSGGLRRARRGAPARMRARGFSGSLRAGGWSGPHPVRVQGPRPWKARCGRGAPGARPSDFYARRCVSGCHGGWRPAPLNFLIRPALRAVSGRRPAGGRVGRVARGR